MGTRCSCRSTRLKLGDSGQWRGGGCMRVYVFGVRGGEGWAHTLQLSLKRVGQLTQGRVRWGPSGSGEEWAHTAAVAQVSWARRGRWDGGECVGGRVLKGRGFERVVRNWRAHCSCSWQASATMAGEGAQGSFLGVRGLQGVVRNGHTEDAAQWSWATATRQDAYGAVCLGTGASSADAAAAAG